jgi:uncharacterized protein (TIGR04255 family)
MAQAQLAVNPTGDLADVPTPIGAIVRHGSVPEGTVIPGIPEVRVEAASYLLDLDVFTSSSQEFSPTKLREQFLRLHDQIDRFFYWSLSTEGGAHFDLKIRS